MSLKIRPATGADFGARQAVIRMAWEEAYTLIYTPGEIASLFAGESNQRTTWEADRTEELPGLVAIKDDMVVGTCGLALRSDEEGEIASLYVDPAYQGQGVGTALWNEAVSIFIEWECPALVVYVLKRANAVDFYKARGAQVAGIGTFWVGYHQEQALCLRLLLNSKSIG